MIFGFDASLFIATCTVFFLLLLALAAPFIDGDAPR